MCHFVRVSVRACVCVCKFRQLAVHASELFFSFFFNGQGQLQQCESTATDEQTINRSLSLLINIEKLVHGEILNRYVRLSDVNTRAKSTSMIGFLIRSVVQKHCKPKKLSPSFNLLW